MRYRCALTDGNLDCLGRLAVYDQHHVHLTASDQTTRHARVDLIQTGEAALRSGIEHFAIRTAELDVHRRSRITRQ